MSRVLLTFVAALTLAASPASADDWKSNLSREFVTVANGKMTSENFQLCKVTVPAAKKSSMQIRSYAEAPASAGISRDFFVGFGTTLNTVTIMAFGEAIAKGSSVKATDALDCDRIEAPIGKVDVEVNLYMTAEGFQYELLESTSGTNKREAKRWEDVFGDK